jgi:hypothetical protein
MSRTLHVIDQPGQVAEAAVLRLSVDHATQALQDPSDQYAWLLFGGEATRDAAHAIGLRDEQFRLMPEPVGLHCLLPAALAQPRQLMSQAHRIVCWTEGATQIASLLSCAHVTRRVEDTSLCSFAKETIEQAHRSSTDTPPDSRVALRQRWGVEPDTTVIALVGDRFGSIDASAAMMAVALTYEALQAVQPERKDVRLLCHPLAMRRREASELGGLLEMDHLLIQDAAVSMPWSILPGCDATLAINPADSGLSILWAQASGVPIFASLDKRLPMLASLDRVIPMRGIKPREMADALTKWIKTPSPQPMAC